MYMFDFNSLCIFLYFRLFIYLLNCFCHSLLKCYLFNASKSLWHVFGFYDLASHFKGQMRGI